MLKLLSLFSGIGAFEKALTNIGEPYRVVNYCEKNKYASKAYSLIHNLDENMNLGDITEVDTNKLHEDIDIITYGFPCQDISYAGKGKGFVDDNGELTRSGLFFQALRVIEDTMPKIAIAENVKALTSKRYRAEFKIVLDSLNTAGYTNYWAVLNAKDYGIPQNRERVFIISIRNDIAHGFKFPKKYELKLKLKDLLEDNVDEKYYVDLNKCGVLHSITSNDRLNIINNTKQGFIEGYEGDYVNLRYPGSNTRRGRVITQCCGTLQCDEADGVIVRKPKLIGGFGVKDFGKQFRQGNRVYDADEIAMCIMHQPVGNLGGYSYLYQTDLGIRKLTPKENFRLMGFDDADCDILSNNGISNTQIYKMAGNSIVVDVLEEIFVELLNQYEDVFPYDGVVAV